MNTYLVRVLVQHLQRAMVPSRVSGKKRTGLSSVSLQILHDVIEEMLKRRLLTLMREESWSEIQEDPSHEIV